MGILGGRIKEKNWKNNAKRKERNFFNCSVIQNCLSVIKYRIRKILWSNKTKNRVKAKVFVFFTFMEKQTKKWKERTVV